MALAPLLIIEDDRDLREALVDTLETEGYAVVSAFDGRDALELLQSGFLPRLILLDLMMPRLSGSGFHQAISGNPTWNKIPIVIFSADPNGPAVAQQIGAAGFLKKPVQLDHLLDFAARFS